MLLRHLVDICGANEDLGGGQRLIQTSGGQDVSNWILSYDGISDLYLLGFRFPFQKKSRKGMGPFSYDTGKAHVTLSGLER